MTQPRPTGLDDPAAAAEAVQAYRDGATLKQLAARYNVGWATLHRVLTAAGVRVRDKNHTNRERQRRAEIRHQRPPESYTLPPEELARLRRMVGIQ